MDNFEPAAELRNEMWGKVMKINVEGPFKAMRGALQIFLKKGSGVIVNINSVGGLDGARAGAAYITSKHALIGLIKNTGYMYSKAGIHYIKPFTESKKVFKNSSTIIHIVPLTLYLFFRG